MPRRIVLGEGTRVMSANLRLCPSRDQASASVGSRAARVVKPRSSLSSGLAMPTVWSSS